MREGRWLRRHLGAAALSLFFGCAGALPQAETGVPLEGKVSLAGAGIGGAEAFVLPADGPFSGEVKPVARTASGPDGSFRLNVAPGNYVLLARMGGRFSFYGRNPVRVHAPQKGLNLPLVDAHPVSYGASQAGQEAIAGRVLRAGKPASGVRVTAYLDLNTGLRGPGYASSELTGGDGAYVLTLPPGTYALAARQRVSGSDTGPLGPGDLFGIASEFPLLLHEGQSARIDIDLSELPTRERMARLQGRFSLLQGTAVTSTGEPIDGIRVCLYDNKQMINQPVLVSEPTASDGRFSIETPLTGVFYLGARQRLGGPPQPGEKVGFYVGAPDGRVELSPGARLRDLRIVVQVVR